MFYMCIFCTKFWHQQLQCWNVTRESCEICFYTKKAQVKCWWNFRFDSQQSLVEDDPEDRPITLELSRFYVSPTDLTSKDNKDDSISVDKTSTTSVETKQPLSAKNSFDTESVSTVSTIDYQSRVITVAEIHRHVDNVDNKYLDENYNERRYEMDAEMSSEMSEDGTTETMSDDDDHQRSINSMASSLNRCLFHTLSHLYGLFYVDWQCLTYLKMCVEISLILRSQDVCWEIQTILTNKQVNSYFEITNIFGLGLVLTELL